MLAVRGSGPWSEPIIGRTTTYHGSEHRYLAGYTVRIVAVMKGAAGPDFDADVDSPYLTDDRDVARAGGVTENDRVEVQPWIEKEGRITFVTMACFAKTPVNRSGEG